MVIGWGYLYINCFLQLTMEPLNLTQGSIEENIRLLRLRNAGSIQNENVLRMRNLLDEVDNSFVVRLLTLTLNTPASSKLVEQAHAAGAMIMKRHDIATEKQLRIRALCTSMAAFFGEPRVSKAMKNNFA